MSSYHRPAYHPPTGTVRDALWADDYFGRHQYAVLFEGDEVAYQPEDVAIPADKVFVPQECVRELETAMRAAMERSPLTMADAMAFSELLGDE